MSILGYVERLCDVNSQSNQFERLCSQGRAREQANKIRKYLKVSEDRANAGQKLEKQIAPKPIAGNTARIVMENINHPGKNRPVDAAYDQAMRRMCLVMLASEWVWKLAVIALAYLILYFTFGYFIAWRNPLVLEYYGGIDEGSFFAHMSAVLSNTSWLIPFQILRAMFWAVLALPVIRMMKGQWPETSLAIGLLFAVVMNTQLRLPNPCMPEAVRITHLIETASSKFIFGLLVGWLLTQHHEFAWVAIAQNKSAG